MINKEKRKSKCKRERERRRERKKRKKEGRRPNGFFLCTIQKQTYKMNYLANNRSRIFVCANGDRSVFFLCYSFLVKVKIAYKRIFHHTFVQFGEFQIE